MLAPSKLNSISNLQCYPKPEEVGPYAKFDRKIELNSVTAESSEWKEFFDSIEKKEEIECKKIFQLGKKIHCIFAFSQKWHFDEEFKGKEFHRSSCNARGHLYLSK